VLLLLRGKAELHNLESENLILSTQNGHYSESIASLQMELASFPNEVEKIKQRELQQMTEVKTEHQAQMDSYEAEIYSLKREISTLNVHVKDVEKKNFDLNSTIKELNDELSSTRSDSQSHLEAASSSVSRQLLQAQAVNQELNQVLGVMQGDLKRSQQEINNLLSRVRSVFLFVCITATATAATIISSAIDVLHCSRTHCSGAVEVMTRS
jgi:chromosome segregation ATPase